MPHGPVEKGSTPSRGLDNNPGKDAKLFNEKHPYFPRNCSSCPFKTASLRSLFHSLADKKNCYTCKALNEQISDSKVNPNPVAKNLSPEFILSRNKEIEKAKTIKSKIKNFNNIETGKFLDSSNGLIALINHCFTFSRLKAALYLRGHIDELIFVRKSEFGEGKDLSKSKDRKNLKRKKRRGVAYYNLYSWKYMGINYDVKLEVNKKGYESLYWIKRKD